jgi:hypothetical protein
MFFAVVVLSCKSQESTCKLDMIYVRGVRHLQSFCRQFFVLSPMYGAKTTGPIAEKFSFS